MSGVVIDASDLSRALLEFGVELNDAGIDPNNVVIELSVSAMTTLHNKLGGLLTFGDRPREFKALQFTFRERVPRS